MFTQLRSYLESWCIKEISVDIFKLKKKYHLLPIEILLQEYNNLVHINELNKIHNIYLFDTLNNILKYFTNNTNHHVSSNTEKQFTKYLYIKDLVRFLTVLWILQDTVTIQLYITSSPGSNVTLETYQLCKKTVISGYAEDRCIVDKNNIQLILRLLRIDILTNRRQQRIYVPYIMKNIISVQKRKSYWLKHRTVKRAVQKYQKQIIKDNKTFTHEYSAQQLLQILPKKYLTQNRHPNDITVYNIMAHRISYIWYVNATHSLYAQKSSGYYDGQHRVVLPYTTQYHDTDIPILRINAQNNKYPQKKHILFPQSIYTNALYCYIRKNITQGKQILLIVETPHKLRHLCYNLYKQQIVFQIGVPNTVKVTVCSVSIINSRQFDALVHNTTIRDSIAIQIENTVMNSCKVAAIYKEGPDNLVHSQIRRVLTMKEKKELSGNAIHKYAAIINQIYAYIKARIYTTEQKYTQLPYTRQYIYFYKHYLHINRFLSDIVSLDKQKNLLYQQTMAQVYLWQKCLSILYQQNYHIQVSKEHISATHSETTIYDIYKKSIITAYYLGKDNTRIKQGTYKHELFRTLVCTHTKQILQNITLHEREYINKRSHQKDYLEYQTFLNSTMDTYKKALMRDLYSIIT